MLCCLSRRPCPREHCCVLGIPVYKQVCVYLRLIVYFSLLFSFLSSSTFPFITYLVIFCFVFPWITRQWFCLCFCRAAQFVAPFGSYQALLGTNPIAVGIPREEGKEPIVLDMATAAFPCESTACSSSVGIGTEGEQTRCARTQQCYERATNCEPVY